MTVLTGVEGKQVIYFGKVKMLVALTVSDIHIYVRIHEEPPEFADKNLYFYESCHIFKNGFIF